MGVCRSAVIHLLAGLCLGTKNYIVVVLSKLIFSDNLH